MEFFRYREGMSSWYGLYEGISVLDSINDYRFAIRQTEVGSGVYECYFPNPNVSDTCIHITNISREGIISILEDCDELDAFLREQNLSEDDLRGEIAITAILMYLDDSFDIIEFFDLQDRNESSYSKSTVSEIVLKSFRKVSRNMYSFFDELLERRNLDRCPEYLWKIKVTDDEYQELKEYIANKIRVNAACNSYEREAALLFAEYHRREYGFRSTGDHNDNRPKALVFNSLGIIEQCEIDADSFAEIAGRGANRLGIQLYTSDRTQYVFSLFYHGGLPLKKLSQNPSHPSWHRLIRYIIESDDLVDFSNIDDLVTGVIANRIDALKAFCRELQNAILTKDYQALPFFCTSEEDPRYQMFQNLGQKAIAEIKNKNPFRLAWIFDLNMSRKVIHSKCCISGPDSIPIESEFIRGNNLTERDSFTISCFEEGNELMSVVYNKNQNQNDFYGERPLYIELAYSDITNISVRCPELDNQILISEELDIDSPQIISENEDGEYEMTRNKLIGHKEVVVIVPERWSIENEHDYDIDDKYDYLGKKTRIIILPRGIENQSVILFDNNGSRKTISAIVPLAKVVVMNSAVTNHLRESAFYDVRNLVYYIKRSDGSLRRISREDLRFCSDRRTGEWLENPPLGYIFVKSANDAAYADPLRILNLGDERNSLRIHYPHANAESCSISVEWDNGIVVRPNGIWRNGAWHFVKNNLEDSRYVTFNFTPDHQAGNSFSLSVKTKFSDFQIFDEEGHLIQSGECLSLADLPRYHYQIQNIDFNLNARIGVEGDNGDRDEKYTYKISTADNNRERISVTVHDEFNGRDKVYTVLRESSLDNLFGGMELLNKIINRYPGDIRSTSIFVSARINNRTFNFQIKKYPFDFLKNERNEIEIVTRTQQPVRYVGLVKAIPLYEYEGVVSETLYQNEDGNYLLPEEAREWGDVLLYSGKGEWVLPHFIDCTINGENPAGRSDRWNNIYLPMKREEYPNAPIWNETWRRGCYWFEIAHKEHIPASSIYDLLAIMSSSKLMARFVFNMLLRGLKEGNFADYKAWLNRALLDMAEYNSFLWIWVHEEDCYLNNLGFNNVNWDELKGFVLPWCLYKPNDESLKLLERIVANGEASIEDSRSFFVAFFQEEYTEFINELRYTSLGNFLKDNRKNYTPQQFLERLSNPKFVVPDYVNDSIEALYYNPDNEEIFERYLNDEIRRRPMNFRLFYERAKMFFLTIKRDGEEDIFSYKPSIRKSVLYYTSHFKDEFIQLCTYKVN